IVMKAIQIFYEGRVQGVGFRYSVRQIAKGFNVTGWVRNLRDGRVELQVSGEEEEANAFLEAIRQSDLGSLIKKESEHVLATPPDSRGFEIRTSQRPLFASSTSPKYSPRHFDGAGSSPCRIWISRLLPVRSTDCSGQTVRVKAQP